MISVGECEYFLSLIIVYIHLDFLCTKISDYWPIVVVVVVVVVVVMVVVMVVVVVVDGLYQRILVL